MLDKSAPTFLLRDIHKKISSPLTLLDSKLERL
jgi:hypothetical protein